MQKCGVEKWGAKEAYRDYQEMLKINDVDLCNNSTAKRLSS